MYTVTKIEQQKKDANRSSVFVNETFAFGMSNKDLKRYNLMQGMQLSKEDYERLTESIQLDKAKYKALDYISYTSRTEKQVREKLMTLEYEIGIVEKVISFLCKYNYINDEEYVRQYISDGVRYKNKSIKKLKYELYTKGITSIEIDSREDLGDVEQQNVIKLLKKYKYSSDIDYKERQKIIRKLLSRGFSYDIIKECLYNIDETFEL